MNAQALIDKIRAAREVWLELESAVASVDGVAPGRPALRVKVRRPAEADTLAFARGTFADGAARVVVGWEGFSEATLFGAAVGSGDPLPFDADLWAEIVRDRTEWIVKVTERATQLVKEHAEARQSHAKN
jgi:hypothetical protein